MQDNPWNIVCVQVLLHGYSAGQGQPTLSGDEQEAEEVASKCFSPFTQ